MDDIVGLGKVSENTLALTKEVRVFLASIFGPLLGPVTEEIGQYFADSIRMARHDRFARWIRCAEESQKQLEALGEHAKAVSPKLLFPIIENSSLEEDDYLQQKWVNLLTSAAIGNDIHPSYPRILAELNPLDAKILEILFEYHRWEEIDRKSAAASNSIRFVAGLPGYASNMLTERLNVLPDDISINLDNLERLNLCYQKEFDVPSQAWIEDRSVYKRYFISSLGVGFVRAVSKQDSRRGGNDC